MLAAQFRRRCYLTLLLCVIAAGVSAQPMKKDKEFEPQVGQEGKDVIWVPTPEGLIAKMLDMTKVTAADTVIDLGSGDGRTVIAAAKRGAKALGIEYNPDMVELSKRNAEKAGVAGKGELYEGRPFRERLFAGDRDHDVPAADDQSQAAPENPRPEAGHAHRVARIHDGRLAGGSDRIVRRPHRLHVDRAGEGRRQLAAR
jgi:SAM-dependent methyltransferase